MPRLRTLFRRGTEVKYCSHLDLMRMWVRALRRAAIPLAYSQGFNPHAIISLAAPLPVGVVGHEEIFDLALAEPVDPADYVARVNAALPVGVAVLDAWPIPDDAPPLQPRLRAADFRLTLFPREHPPDLVERAAALLAAETLPRERRVEGKAPKRYDLRPLILGLRVELPPDPAGEAVILATLRNDHTGAGRPEELADALGVEPSLKLMERLRLHFAEGTPLHPTPASRT